MLHSFSSVHHHASLNLITPNPKPSASVYRALCVQIPALISIKEESTAALAGGIICLLTLAAYCAFQVLYPELQKRQVSGFTGWSFQDPLA